MPWLFSRRAFLNASCAGALGLGLPGSARAAVRADSPDVAIDPDLVASGVSRRWAQAMRRDLGWAAQWRPVASGEVLRQLAAGDVPVGLYLAPAQTDPRTGEVGRLAAEGLIHDRRTLAHTDALLWGPASDPAGIRGEADPVRALQQIWAAQAAGAANWQPPAPGSALHALVSALTEGALRPASASASGSARRPPPESPPYRLLSRAQGAVPPGGKVWLEGHPALRLHCEVARSFRAPHPGGRLLVEWLGRPLAQSALRSAQPAWQLVKG